METPIFKDEEIEAIAERYGITTLNPDDATHYKLCQVIKHLESEIAELQEQAS
jgi:hypothetical protein